MLCAFFIIFVEKFNAARDDLRRRTRKHLSPHAMIGIAARDVFRLPMRKFVILSAVLCTLTAATAQKPWKMRLTDPVEKINLRLDLYEESIEVPGMEAFGPMNGYMDGSIYGIWYVVSFDIKDDRNATVTIANDLGSEDQKLSLTQTTDSTYQLKFLGYNAVKRAQGKKLVKIPGELKMVRADK